MCRDIVKEVNDGIKALGKEVVALRKENEELKKVVALSKPLVLTLDKEVKDGRR
tara:strand:+ start:439 stop:600 length:162 start_codon:yes stop_codon:yes gene_type:complete